MERTERAASAEPYAHYLGWLSVGLGLAGLLAPRHLSHVTGIRRPGLVRAAGARELANGVGLLTQRNQEPWLWGRVAGDVIDLLVLAAAHRDNPRGRARLLGSAAAVAAIAAADVAVSLRYRQAAASAPAADLLIDRTVIVNKTPQECYEFWRDLSHLPHFMQRINSVTVLDERRSRWILTAPGGAELQWIAELTEDRPGERLRWRTEEGSSIRHAGSVSFQKAPGDRGSFVTVSLHYRAPGGALGAVLAKVLGADPFGEVCEDLRRFKQLIETGEIPTTAGQPSGRRSLFGRLLPEGRKSNQRSNGSGGTRWRAHRSSTEKRGVSP